MKTFFYILVLLLVALPAFAQDDSKALNAEGLKKFSAGEYEVAADFFARAYAIDPQPEFLKNRSVSLYRAKKCPQAISVVSEFLATNPPEREAAEIKGLLRACRVTLAERSVEKEDFASAKRFMKEVTDDPALQIRIDTVRAAIKKYDDDEKAKEDEKLQEEKRREKERLAEEERLREEQRLRDLEASRKANKTDLAPWIAISAGAAIVVGTLIFHIYEKTVTEKEFLEIAANGSSQAEYDKLDKRLRRDNWIVPSLYGVGLATSAVGVGLMFFSGDRADSNVTPGVSWRVSF